MNWESLCLLIMILLSKTRNTLYHHHPNVYIIRILCYVFLFLVLSSQCIHNKQNQYIHQAFMQHALQDCLKNIQRALRTQARDSSQLLRLAGSLIHSPKPSSATDKTSPFGAAWGTGVQFYRDKEYGWRHCAIAKPDSKTQTTRLHAFLPGTALTASSSLPPELK